MRQGARRRVPFQAEVVALVAVGQEEEEVVAMVKGRTEEATERVGVRPEQGLDLETGRSNLGIDDERRPMGTSMNAGRWGH